MSVENISNGGGVRSNRQWRGMGELTGLLDGGDRMQNPGGGDGTLHIWTIPGAGRERKCVRGGAGGSGDGDAGGGGVFGGAWVPGGAECAAVLPAFAVEGCGGV